MAMLNVRIDRATKDAGDASLATLGATTSEVTRALWAKLAEGGNEAKALVERILAPSPGAEQEESVARKRAALAQVDASWMRLAQTLDLDGAPNTEFLDDKDCLATERSAYLQEKWGEI